ncbi:hemolysin XhlA [Serratia liquefaciens]|nr:hemolysin XhlA [Serratia liquefaciens]
MAQPVNIRTKLPVAGDSIVTHNESHGGGGNGGGNDMLEREKKLEDQVLTLVTDIAVIKSNYVTKADLHEEISKQTKWIAATIIGTTGLALTVAKLIF